MVIEQLKYHLMGLAHRGDKGWHELAYWRGRAKAEKSLGNSHYQKLYTEMFGVDLSLYEGKRVLDIGCGPRGSLEWADGAEQRVGLDPLVNGYKQFGIDRHKMEYVNALAEKIPFADGHFDIVTSINSLDHVDDPSAAMAEIARVLKQGGDFLLEVEIGHEPTPMEPITFWFDILDDLSDNFETLNSRAFEINAEHQVHSAWTDGVPFDESKGKHAGVLIAHLRRR